jgi:hypothetical protein
MTPPPNPPEEAKASIQRWRASARAHSVTGNPAPEMIANEDGRWVNYADHMDAMASAQRATEEARGECEWMNEEESEDGYSWGTGCGHVFYLDQGDPASNSMKFCPFCGGTLKRGYHKEDAT